MLSMDGFTFRNAADIIYDFALPSLLITVVWKSRGMYDDAKAFFAKANRHMDVVENGLIVLLNNHAPHIEEYLRTLIQRESGEVNVKNDH